MGQSKGDKLVEIVIYVCLSLTLLVVLYPLVFVISASLSDPGQIMKGNVWLWPVDLTIDSYTKVFHNKNIMSGYMNTIMYTVVGTVINLFLTTMISYPLSRKDFAGRNIITGFMVFTMFFSGGMIPTYLLVRDLGMLNTIWALVIPGAVSVWNVVIMRTFFQSSIPHEIQESAQMDGCTNIQILLRIVLPLSMPILAVMTLFYSVGHWNAFFNALIYLTDRSKFPLQLFLREILIQQEMTDMVQVQDETLVRHMMQVEGLKYAVVVVANLPILMLYPFLQKYFVKGVMVGALKG